VEEALVVLHYALTNNAEPESKDLDKYDDNIQNDDNENDENIDKNINEDDEKSNQQSKKHKSPRKKKH